MIRSYARLTAKSTKAEKALAGRVIERRLLRHFDEADEATIAVGTAWYDEAQAVAEKMAWLQVMPMETAAAALAILSPRKRWATNVAMGLAWGRGHHFSTLGDQERKLARLANGEDPDAVVGGLKVRSFWRNICGDVNAVTVDIWALRAAIGGEVGDDEYRPMSAAAWRYDLIADAYRRAARRRGVDPSTMQAVVWIVARGDAA